MCPIYTLHYVFQQRNGEINSLRHFMYWLATVATLNLALQVVQVMVRGIHQRKYLTTLLYRKSSLSFYIKYSI